MRMRMEMAGTRTETEISDEMMTMKISVSDLLLSVAELV